MQTNDRLRPTRTHYEVLGIERDAPSHAVERAYWQFVQGWRNRPPNGQPPEITLDDVNEAYQVLMSSEGRVAYDAELSNVEREPQDVQGAGEAPSLKVLGRVKLQARDDTPGRGGRSAGWGLLGRLFRPSYLLVSLLAFAAMAGAFFAFSESTPVSAGDQMLMFFGGGALVLGLLATVRMLERRNDAKKLVETELKLQSLFEHANDAIWSVDADGTFTSISPSGEELLGYSAAELAHMKVAEIMPGTQVDALEELTRTTAEGATSTKAELELFTRNGVRVPVELTAVPLEDQGKPSGALWIARDESGRKRFQQELNHLASKDPLTGLYNRRRFEEELNLEVGRCRRDERPSAVLFLDLDHFKDVNDVLGHAAGDELLVRISELLTGQLRETDILARLGGDEFTIILPQTELEQARDMADRLIDAVGSHEVALHGQTIPMTASIGIARIPEDGRTPQELLASADMAMYQAKEMGRNRVCDYGGETDLQGLVEKRLEWRRRIADAIAHDLLLLHGQPILDMKRGGVTQYELLLRMPTSDGGVYEAAKFIDNAERFGMMRPIDRWVVREGIQMAATYGRRQPGLSFELNISGHAFNDNKLLQIIRSELVESRADPGSIVFEVTEGAAINNIDVANRFVSEVKKLGCRFALDDFGVGFSSLHQLKTLDVDFLKIDGAFVRNLANDSVDQHLVRAIVEVSRALGKETIAEFVGDGQTLSMLREFGVDFAQGYHVGHPASLDDLIVGRQRQAA